MLLRTALADEAVAINFACLGEHHTLGLCELAFGGSRAEDG